SLQQMCSRNVCHVERRILPHEHDIRIAQIEYRGGAKREVVVPFVAHLKRSDVRGYSTIPQRQVTRTVVEKLVVSLLRFHGKCKGRVASDVDSLYRVHLDCND